jgi:hypothetical protein
LRFTTAIVRTAMSPGDGDASGLDTRPVAGPGEYISAQPVRKGYSDTGKIVRCSQSTAGSGALAALRRPG